MNSDPEAVLNCFDLDGTLYELKGGSFSESPLSSDLDKQIQSFLDEEIPRSELSRGEFQYALSRGYRGETSLAVEGLFGISREEYFERTWGRLEPQEYIGETFCYQDLFDGLEPERFVLVTSAPEVWAEKVISELGLEQYFSAVRTGEPEPRKPSPSTFEEPIQRALGSEKPEEIYFLGDQVSDFPDSMKWDAVIETVYVGQESVSEDTDYQVRNIMGLTEVKKPETSS